MAWNSNVTFAGRVVTDPVLRFLPSGKAVLNFRMAVSRKVQDDYVSSFYEVTAWERLAERAADILEKGLKVVVTGTLYIEEYETNDGAKGKAVKVTADLIGADVTGVDSVVKTATGAQREAEKEPVLESAW